MKINFLLISLLIILTEAITELLVKSSIFEPVRKFFFIRRDYKACKFLHELLDCGYCSSVWIAYILYLSVYGLPLDKGSIFVSILFPLIIHRMANVLHFIIDRINKHN
jgi:hypothetical protein